MSVKYSIHLFERRKLCVITRKRMHIKFLQRIDTGVLKGLALFNITVVNEISVWANIN